MKKTFTLTLIAALFSITTFASDRPGPGFSKISITSNDRSMMQVKIDGAIYNLNNQFVLDNIRSGNHSITIMKTQIAGFRKKTQVVYNSSFFISPAQQVSIDINRFGKVTMSKSSLDRFNHDDHSKGNDRKNDNRNEKNYNNENDHYGRY